MSFRTYPYNLLWCRMLSSFFFLELLLTVDGLPGTASRQLAARPQSQRGDGVWNDNDHE